MSDLLQTAQAWLAGQFQAYLSRQVTYIRGAQQRTFAATAGKTLLKLDDGLGGVVMIWTDRDYSFPPANLAGFGEPLRGDRIVDSVDGLTYEVDVYGSDPHYTVDPERSMYRIHCKRILA